MYYGYYHEENQRITKKVAKKKVPFYVKFAHIANIAISQGWIVDPYPLFFNNRKGEKLTSQARTKLSKGSRHPIHRTPGFGNKEYGKSGVVFNKVTTRGYETIVNKRFI